MLTSPLCFSPPWHSKQYFWNVSGAWNAAVPARGDDRWTGWGRRDGAACAAWTGAGGEDGAWAVMMDTPADTSATHTPQRVIDLNLPLISLVDFTLARCRMSRSNNRRKEAFRKEIVTSRCPQG